MDYNLTEMHCTALVKYFYFHEGKKYFFLYDSFLTFSDLGVYIGNHLSSKLESWACIKTIRLVVTVMFLLFAVLFDPGPCSPGARARREFPPIY